MSRSWLTAVGVAVAGAAAAFLLWPAPAALPRVEVVAPRPGAITLTINKNVLMLARLEEELKTIVEKVPGVTSVTTKIGKGFHQPDIYRRYDFEMPSKVLLVDEPSKGLAPAIIANMVEAFRELKRAGTTMLVVEQNFHFARSLGDTVAVMDSGRIVHTGRMDALAADEALQQRLLGLSLEAHQ